MPHTGGKRRGTRHAKKRSTRRMRKGTRKMKRGGGCQDCGAGYMWSESRQKCISMTSSHEKPCPPSHGFFYW